MYIFDLDGTLADITHRLEYAKAKDWDKFFELCRHDKPIVRVLRLYKDLRASPGTEIEIWTGRSEITRYHTQIWLERNGVFNTPLRMRPQNDRRPDYELKREWLHSLNAYAKKVTMVFEDRDRVVQMYRDNDIACVQVKEGNY